MGTMGKYCKAYPIARLRAYERWHEKADNARKDKQTVDGHEVEMARTLTEKDHLYLQETYVVTDGIYLDEHVIFDEVTPEWIAFCKTALNFEIPVYKAVPVNGQGSHEEAALGATS